MRHHEIWLADLNAFEVFEQGGKRLEIIILGDDTNEKSGQVILFPLISRLKNFAGNVVCLPNEINSLTLQSDIFNFQIFNVSSSRLISRTGDTKRCSSFSIEELYLNLY